MIRVELLGRQRRWSPWSKALLSALVVCGGLYGIHLFLPTLAGSLFSADSALSPAAQQEAASSPVVQREIEPKPAVQEATPSPVAQQETTLSPVQEIEPKPAAQQDTLSSPVAQRDTMPSPVAQQEIPSKPVAQETASSPVQDPVVQPEATPSSSTPIPTPSQRSTACLQIMRIDEQVPAGIRVASLICNSTGEYWLEGTSPSHKVLRTFRLSLQALPSQVSFSTWQEERTLRFAFQGHFAERDTPPLDSLSSDQAEQFFSKVARWAEASGLDSLSIHEPIHRSMSSAHTHQRQKLQGLGSPQQIDAFLQQLQQAEAVATLGEILLLPVTSNERGWVKARLYAAVDIIVDGP